MNVLKLQAGAETADRRTHCTKISSRRVREKPRALLLLGAIVIMSWGWCARSAEPTYKLFGREVGGYSSKDDLPGMVKKEIGPRASIADWDEIKRQHGNTEAGLKAFCDRIGLGPNSSAWVTQGGKRFWQEQRHYFLYRANHKLPEDFMLHDQLQDNFLLLGSWYDARPVLVKVVDFDPSDAEKWAKWDALFKAANENTISGAYTLMTVNGKQLPATISHDGQAQQIRSGTFTIQPDGKCSSKLTFGPPGGAVSTIEVAATSTRDGPRLRLQWERAGTTSGIIASNTFTMENEGIVFSYKK